MCHCAVWGARNQNQHAPCAFPARGRRSDTRVLLHRAHSSHKQPTARAHTFKLLPTSSGGTPAAAGMDTALRSLRGQAQRQTQRCSSSSSSAARPLAPGCSRRLAEHAGAATESSRRCAAHKAHETLLAATPPLPGIACRAVRQRHLLISLFHLLALGRSHHRLLLHAHAAHATATQHQLATTTSRSTSTPPSTRQSRPAPWLVEALPSMVRACSTGPSQLHVIRRSRATHAVELSSAAVPDAAQESAEVRGGWDFGIICKAQVPFTACLELSLVLCYFLQRVPCAGPLLRQQSHTA